MLATAYWAASARGGVTRQGVVLTYLLSFVIGSQSPPPLCWEAYTSRDRALSGLPTFSHPLIVNKTSSSSHRRRA